MGFEYAGLPFYGWLTAVHTAVQIFQILNPNKYKFKI